MGFRVTRSRWVGAGAIALACVLVLGEVSGAATPEGPERNAATGSFAPPDRIDLPDGWQPEGITANGKFLYVGSLADGAIWRTNLKNGDKRVLVEGEAGRVAVGLHYDRRRDLLWVAGGETGELRAYEAGSGQLLRTYAFPSADERFLNDVAVLRGVVAVTDSLQPELGIVRVRGQLPPPEDATTLPLTGDIEYEDDFNLNGIVRSQQRLLAVQSNTGLLFEIGRHTGKTRQVDLDGELLTNGDGMVAGRQGTVYVVRNNNNLIAVLDIAPDVRSGELVATIEDDDFDVPTTAALTRGSLWAVNARFSTPAEPDTNYWITRVDKYDG